MGLFSSIATSIKGLGNIKKGGQSDTSKPFHTHDSSPKNKQASIETDITVGDVSRPDASFMGKNQVDSFKTLTDPLSVDRGGRTVAQPDGLDKVGVLPAMNPPMAVPVDVDQKGINSLYADKI